MVPDTQLLAQGGKQTQHHTFSVDTNRTALQPIIYGELFGSSMKPFLEPGSSGEGADSPLPFFDLDSRLDYVEYCIQNLVCKSYPGVGFLPVGRYAPENRDTLPPDQYELASAYPDLHAVAAHVGGCKWLWDMEKGPFDDDEKDSQKEDEGVWRLKLIRDALQTMGIEGMQLLTLPREIIPPELLLVTVRKIRDQIEALKQPPPVYIVGDVLQAPVSQDVYVCMATYWRGTN
ncbi:uncharacterized protein PADG_06326 [Paracoccidioides brasiliensis Pb18]|uniref:Uncharacterized protein n=1 Tax=Paracoccidioides brasiliensis (strain Pb18) TaxID=502780 RepID=C1GG89_PARBD|nr:uncharacterized protein PADG_06326 [Paracoccidioides brasiliensis Pb18]EEH50247.2 hypothetical protein PADG_06326 [Paracoccidioides brasiliensis Pb18]